MSSIFSYFTDNKVKLRGIIHVGAHRGEEVFDYEKLGAQQIIWIEPNPDVFEEMKVFLTKARTRVESKAFKYAASNVDHQIADFNIYYGPDAGYLRGNKGCSSLLQANGRFIDWYQKTIQVETITIDTLIYENQFNYQDFDLLNMDVQGAEMLVLQGSNKVLENVKYITTEATWNNPDYYGNVMYHDLKLYLESRGFVEKQIMNHTKDWGDVLLVKE